MAQTEIFCSLTEGKDRLSPQGGPVPRHTILFSNLPIAGRERPSPGDDLSLTFRVVKDEQGRLILHDVAALEREGSSFLLGGYQFTSGEELPPPREGDEVSLSVSAILAGLYQQF